MRNSIFITVILALIAVFALFFLRYKIQDPNKHQNGFKRVELSGFITSRKEISLMPGRTRDICGITDKDVFLTTHNADLIIDVNFTSGNTDSIKLNLPALPFLNPVFYSTVQYPDIFILAGNTHKIVRGNLKEQEYEVLPAGNRSFGNGLVVNSNLFLFRAIDTSTRESLFTVFNSNNQSFMIEKDITARRSDIGISSAGDISMDPANKHLVFVSRYSNDVVLFDTNLLVLHRAQTIDTFRTPQVTIARRATVITHAIPPVTINRRAKLFDGILWVQSAIKADNESFADFRDRTVIDIYKGSTLRYLGTFYLPYKEGQVRDFTSAGMGKLVFLCDKSLLLCQYETSMLNSLLQ